MGKQISHFSSWGCKKDTIDNNSSAIKKPSQNTNNDPNVDLYHELKVVKKLIQTGGAYFLDYFTTNVTMSTQYIDMLKAW